MNTTLIINRGNQKVGLLPISSGHQMASSRDKSNLLRRNPGRRAKHQTAGKTSSAGDLSLLRYNLRSRSKSSLQEEDDDVKKTKASYPWSMGNLCRTAFARASSNPTGSPKNETWDEVVTTFSAPKRAASHKLVKHVQSRSVHINGNPKSGCSQSLPRPTEKKAPLKPSLVSDTTTRSKVVKHVHFTHADNEIMYEVAIDDIKNSWLDIDVSSSIESTDDENHDMIVSFGPTGRFTLSDMDLCKNGKEYMVRIQKRRLINEMLGQRTNLRQSVLEEQARQKRNGVVDAEELHAVASEQSKWGVEIAKSNWWLSRP
jgi:hypothetical protein